MYLFIAIRYTLSKRYSVSEKETLVISTLTSTERFPTEILLQGKIEYLLKWDGYPEDDATWESKQNIFSYKLLAEFEKELSIAKKVFTHQNTLSLILFYSLSIAKKKKEEKKKIAQLQRNAEKKVDENNNYQNFLNTQISLEPTGVKAGWDLGDDVEEILGAKLIQIHGKEQLVFLVKW